MGILFAKSYIKGNTDIFNNVPVVICGTEIGKGDAFLQHLTRLSGTEYDSNRVRHIVKVMDRINFRCPNLGESVFLLWNIKNGIPHVYLSIVYNEFDGLLASEVQTFLNSVESDGTMDEYRKALEYFKVEYKPPRFMVEIF